MRNMLILYFYLLNINIFLKLGASKMSQLSTGLQETTLMLLLPDRVFRNQP